MTISRASKLALVSSVAGLVVVVGGAAAPGIAAIDEGGDESSSMAIQEFQDSVSGYVSAVEEAATTDGVYSSEYLDVDRHSLVVKGASAAAPSSVQALFDSAPDGLAVGWEETDYTASQMDAAMAAVMESTDHVASISPNDDYSGVDVTVATGGLSSSAVDGVWTDVEKTVADELGRDADVSQDEVDSLGELSSSADTRQADGSPFKGGARIHSSTGASCTSAYPVSVDENGKRRMLTAYHCTDGKPMTWSTPAGATVGTMSSMSSEYYDAALIMPPDDASVKPRIYAGAYNANDALTVTSYAKTIPIGSYVCASGSYTGVTCLNKVIQKQVLITFTTKGGHTQTVYTVKVENTAGTNGKGAWGHGDSGSPVYTQTGADTASIAGHVSAINANAENERPCLGVPTSSTRRCSSVGYFVPYVAMIKAFDVTLVTG